MTGPLIPDDVAAVWDAEVDREDKPGPLERLCEPAKKDAKLADDYCVRCDRTVMPFAVEYDYTSPEHYDGTSEYQCPRCDRREGRWTGRVLTGGATEPRYGVERGEVIEEEQRRHSEGTQPR